MRILVVDVDRSHNSFTKQTKRPPSRTASHHSIYLLHIETLLHWHSHVVSASSPIAVSDNFHFSHYYWKSWDLSTEDQSEAESSDTEGDILTPNPVKHEDIKLKFYNSVLGDDTNNIHFGKWDNIAPDQPDAYGNASQAMTDYMFQLALDLQPHRLDDFTYVDLGSGTAASAISIAERYPQVARAACLNLCHEQNISASHSIQRHGSRGSCGNCRGHV